MRASATPSSRTPPSPASRTRAAPPRCCSGSSGSATGGRRGSWISSRRPEFSDLPTGASRATSGSASSRSTSIAGRRLKASSLEAGSAAPPPVLPRPHSSPSRAATTHERRNGWGPVPTMRYSRACANPDDSSQPRSGPTRVRCAGWQVSGLRWHTSPRAAGASRRTVSVGAARSRPDRPAQSLVAFVEVKTRRSSPEAPRWSRSDGGSERPRAPGRALEAALRPSGDAYRFDLVGIREVGRGRPTGEASSMCRTRGGSESSGNTQ